MGLLSSTSNTKGILTQLMWPEPKTNESSNSRRSAYSYSHISFGAASKVILEKVRYLQYACSSLIVGSHKPCNYNHSRNPSS